MTQEQAPYYNFDNRNKFSLILRRLLIQIADFQILKAYLFSLPIRVL